jgi:acetyl esterase
MRQLLARIERAGHPPPRAQTPQQARAGYEKAAGVLDIPRAPLPRVEDLGIPTRDGHALHARLYAAQARGSEPLPALLYFHGGGFTIGSVHTHEPLARRLAELSGGAVVSVDYRLAPEWKFPTAVEDAWDSLAWLRRQGTALGLDAGRLAVGGDSAGGTLAIVTALGARDAGWPLALQLLFYPGCIGHQDTESHRRYAHGFLLDRADIDYFFGHYLRGPQDRDDWRFAPLDGRDEHGHARDFDGVAPAWLGLAECDPLVDEGIAYADRLRMAGVAVNLEIYRGVVHGFIQFGRALSEARQAHADAAQALRQAWWP